MLWVWIDYHTVRFNLQPYCGSNPIFQLQLSIGRACRQRTHRLCAYPGTLEFSITSHRTSCSFKEASCRMGLEPISPPRSASYPLDERPTVSRNRSDASMKKQPFDCF